MREKTDQYKAKAQAIYDSLEAKVAAIQQQHQKLEQAFAKSEMETIMRILSGAERIAAEVEQEAKS